MRTYVMTLLVAAVARAEAPEPYIQIANEGGRMVRFAFNEPSEFNFFIPCSDEPRLDFKHHVLAMRDVFDKYASDKQELRLSRNRSLGREFNRILARVFVKQVLIPELPELPPPAQIVVMQYFHEDECFGPEPFRTRLARVMVFEVVATYEFLAAEERDALKRYRSKRFSVTMGSAGGGVLAGEQPLTRLFK